MRSCGIPFSFNELASPKYLFSMVLLPCKDVVIHYYCSFTGAVSYRDSKLTRILQPSLGGNAKTAILCNVTPANCHVEESSNTMR